MYGAVIQLIGGGISGGLGGIAANDNRANILDAYSNPPETPDIENEFLNGYFKQLQVTPQLLALDRQLRDQYARSDAQRGLDLYREFLPKYGKANMRALNQVDPQFVQGRNQLFNTVSNDLGYGSQLTPEMAQEIQQYVRGGQAARGNYMGNAPVTEEAFAQGAAGQQLKQQRVSNMMNFLRGPSPEDKFGQIGGAGTPTLVGSTASASNPGFSYIEGPRDWGRMYADAAQTEFGDNFNVWNTRAGAQAAAGPEVNPWLASLAGASGAITGSMGGGGGGGGGSSFMSMFGGSGSKGGTSMGGLGF